MAVKGSGVGLFTIPTAPSVGTSVASTAANTYSATYVTLVTSGTNAALFIPIVSAVVTSSLKPTYCNVQIATGASGSESIVGQIQVQCFNTPVAAAGITQGGTIHIWPPIPVAANVRIAAKVADSIGLITWLVSLQAILQSNVVAEGTINETVNVIQLNGTNNTARDIGASVLLSSGTGTGQLNFTTGVVDANTKQVSGTSQTARDLGASVLLSSGTGAGQITLNSGAVTAGTVSDKTGYSLTQAFPTNFSTLSIDSSGRIDIGKALGTAVTLDANNVLNVSAKYLAGTACTGRDIGASVLLSSGSGTGQLLIASGHISNVDTLTTYTGNTLQTGDSFGRIGAAGVGLTNLGDTRIANLDAAVTTRMATYTQPTGFLAATFPAGTIANTTNITAGTIAAVSSNVAGNVTGSVGSVTGLTASNLDATVSSRLASTAYTAPDNTSVTAIKTKTDSLTFTTATQVDAHIRSVNNVTVSGAGTVGSPWGP